MKGAPSSARPEVVGLGVIVAWRWPPPTYMYNCLCHSRSSIRNVSSEHFLRAVPQNTSERLRTHHNTLHIRSNVLAERRTLLLPNYVETKLRSVTFQARRP